MKPQRKTPKSVPSTTPSQPRALSRLIRLAAVVGAAVLIAQGVWFLRNQQSTEAVIAEGKSDYVDPQVCASCHEDIAATYRKTGMGRSFYRPTAQNVIEDYQRNNTLDHKPSGNSYTMVERDGKFFQRRNTTGFDGRESDVVEEQVDYVIGSGNHARTYLHRTAQGQLHELPVSWYTERSGAWGMSPGYNRPDQEDVRRPVPAECLFCHNGYPRLDDAATKAYESNIFPAKLPEGIDCQRCHGPGRAHIAAAKDKHASPRLVRSTIVNPRDLPRERQMEVCMQCHLETSSSRMPNQLRPYDRGVLSYRSGQALADYALYFDRVKDAKDDTFEVAHAAYRLRQSKCFLKSDMTCITCHDPHDIPRGDVAISSYAKICQNCHQTVAHRTALPAGSNCVSCHMPKRRTDDVVHVVMTDHYIRSYQPPRDLLAPLEETAGSDPSTAVVPYYPQEMEKRQGSELYLAVAQVKDGKDTRSLSRLQAVLARLSPSAPNPYYELGKAYVRRGDNKAAIPWFDAALQHASDYRPALGGLALALMTTGQDARATEVLERAVTAYPSDDLLLTDLGNVYLRMSRPTDAQKTLERAVAVNPERADAHNLLGLVALRVGDKASAEKSFREAIRWQPDLVEAQSNLASLLTGAHQFEEAEFYFTKAIARDPKSADAHHGLGLLLILKGSIPQATTELLEAVRLKPTSSQNHSDFADALAAQGQFVPASEEYRQVLRLKPDQADAQLGLGLALLRLDKAAEARVHLETAAKSSDPEVNQAAAKALGQLGYR